MSAWSTIRNAVSLTENPAKLRARIVATLRRDYRNSLGAALSVARVVEVTNSDSLAAEEPDAALDASDRMMQVIREVQAANPDQVILSDIGPVACDDAHRIEKVLAKMIMSGRTDEFSPGAVMVRAYEAGSDLLIHVSNGGRLIPGAKRKEKTRSFKRDVELIDGKVRVRDPIEVCHELARQLGGELTVTSIDGRPCLTFRMPLAGLNPSAPEPQQRRISTKERSTWSLWWSRVFGGE